MGNKLNLLCAEARNLFWFVIASPNRGSVLLHFHKLVSWKIQKTIYGGKQRYPKVLKDEFNLLNKPEVSQIKSFPRFKSKSWPRDVRLKLAIGELTIPAETEPNWIQKFSDEEEFLSLHRWGWLIHLVTNKPPSEEMGNIAELGDNLIRSWLHFHGPVPEGTISESYSISERLANISLFYRAVSNRWDTIPRDLKLELENAAFYLACNLEFNPFQTGNHVFNNGRGLYLFGVASGLKSYQKFGKAIIKAELSKNLTSDALHREGSSHYHLLFCRWVFEIWTAACEKGDEEFTKFLAAKLRLMYFAAQIFMVNSRKGIQFVCIGDISPDFQVDWLLGVLLGPIHECTHSKNAIFSANPHVWFKDSQLQHNLTLLNPKFKDVQKSKRPKVTQCEASGFFRFDGWGWTALWHVENIGREFFGSHAHHDCGSLVLFFEGEKVLIDPGRVSYVDDEISNYGTSASGHNCLMINGLAGTFSSADYFLPFEYKKFDVATSIHQMDDDVFDFEITHQGFSRIFGIAASKYSRRYIFNERSVSIVDKVLGEGKVKIQTAWHFNDDFKELIDADGNCSIRSNDTQITAVPHAKKHKLHSKFLRNSLDTIGGIQSTKYGQHEPCLTCQFETEGNLPYEATLEVVLEGDK